MKKYELVIWAVVVFLCTFIVFGLGANYGEESVTEDYIYYHYLKDILPETEDNFVTITLDEEGYHVLHDIDLDTYSEMKNNSFSWWNFAFNSRFEGKTIWHEPGSMILHCMHEQQQITCNIEQRVAELEREIHELENL